MFDESNKAIYLQIAQKISDDILRGDLRPGERMLSVREYAASAEVNVNTVNRAYDYLSAQGIVYNKRGVGYFVADDAFDKVKKTATDTFINKDMKQVFDKLILLGFSPEDLRACYQLYIATKTLEK